MATPPSSAAVLSFSPPSSLPIGVRAPATMTDADMGASLGRAGLRGVPPGDDTHGARRRARARSPPRMRKTSQAVVRRHGAGDDGAMTVPTHLFEAIDHVGIAVPDLDE